MDNVVVPTGLMSHECLMRTDVMLPVTQLFVHIHHIGTGLAWFATTCGAGPSASVCTSKHRIKPEIDMVLKMINDHLDESENSMAMHEHIWPLLDVAGAKLRLPIALCKSWLALVRENFPVLCNIVLGLFVKGTNQISKLVKSHTPQYEHYLGDNNVEHQAHQVEDRRLFLEGPLDRRGGLPLRCPR